jgi:hypothetical protein
MRRDVVCRRYVSLALFFILLTAARARAQAVPLHATDAEVADDGDLRYVLTNAAAEPATAWSVSVMMTDNNGSVMLHSMITTDEYRAEALHGRVGDEELNATLLRPHRPRRFVVHGPFDVRMQLTVTPAAVVFLDGRSAGDPQLIDRVFARRAAERDARHDILRQLRDVQAHCTGVSALKEAIARLSRPVDTDPGNTRQIVQNLRSALENGGVDPAKVLADQIDVVAREYHAAVQHAAARKED